MSRDITIGLVVPFATDDVPFEGPIMYPGVRFIPRGVGVRALTPEGYDPAWHGILPAAEYLAKQGVDAIMVIGTSLTFYRGPEAHAKLLDELRTRTGLPVSTMSQAIIDGLHEVGAKRVAVATAYTDVVNRRLKELLAAAGIDVLALEAFDLLEFGGPSKKSEAEIIALSDSAVAKAGASKPDGAEAILISCGGLRTLAWQGRSRPVTGFRSFPPPQRHFGRRCGWSAKAAVSPATGSCSSNRASRRTKAQRLVAGFAIPTYWNGHESPRHRHA